MLQLYEGIKAYRGEDQIIRIFRPDKNMERMNRTATRATLPVSVVVPHCFLASALQRFFALFSFSGNGWISVNVQSPQKQGRSSGRGVPVVIFGISQLWRTSGQGLPDFSPNLKHILDFRRTTFKAKNLIRLVFISFS